jgi:hypothetical protein
VRLPNCKEFECAWAIKLMSEDIQNAEHKLSLCSIANCVCDYQSGKQKASCTGYRNKMLQKVADKDEEGCGLCDCVFECEKADTV